MNVRPDSLHPDSLHQLSEDRGPINDYNAIVLDLAAPNILPSHGMLEEILEAKTDPEKYKNKSMDMKYNAFMKSTTGTVFVFLSFLSYLFNYKTVEKDKNKNK